MSMIFWVGILITGVVLTLAVAVLLRVPAFSRPGGGWVVMAMLLMLIPFWWIVPKLASEEEDLRKHEAARHSMIQESVTFDVLLQLETEKLLRDASSPGAWGPSWLRSKSRLNLREGPGVHYDVVLTIPYGELIRLSSHPRHKGNWIEVKYEGVKGWVHSRYLVVNFVTTKGGLFGWSERPFYTVVQTRLRAEPNPASRVLDTIGTKEWLAKQSQQGYWIKVLYHGKVGWIPADAVRLGRDEETVPLYYRAAILGVKFVFPERTIFGKLLGLGVGVIIGILMALYLPGTKGLFWIKFGIEFSYFMIKNSFQIYGSLSGNELMAMMLSISILTAIVESCTDEAVAKIRGRNALA